ncbi:MAG: hypothetical protein O6850_02390 [Acidobacteria bacterium]|nr:hypothetical protein [Acidobacteriota bacterium]
MMIREEHRVVIFEGDASVRGLWEALFEQGVWQIETLRPEDFESVVLDLHFHSPFGGAMKMTVRTVAVNPADRVFWVSAEVTPSESSRWADSPEVAEEFPVFGFGEFWGAVSQQSNYWVVPPAGGEKSAGARGVHV